MPTEFLHNTQKKLLELLTKNIDEPLTVRELQEKIGASSTSVIAHHMKQLENKGFLKKNPHNPQDYQVLKHPDKEIGYLNLYGLTACSPRGSILDGNPIDRIAISTKLLMFPFKDAFMVKAKGDSMLPKINNGDFVIAQKSNQIKDSEIVVCVNNEEALIKKISKKKDDVILVSLNSEFAPFVAANDFRVEGIVKGVISNKMF